MNFGDYEKKFDALLGLIVVAYMLIVGHTLVFAEAQIEKAPKLFPLDSQPYGTSYAEWTARFWQWLIPQPSGNNAAEDKTGERCANSQRDSNVWFLPGTTGGTFERTCTIPSGKAILISIINVVCSYSTDPDLKSEAELRSCAKTDQDKVDLVSLSLKRDQDKVDLFSFKFCEAPTCDSLQNAANYRIQSPLFNVTYPQDNIFGGQAGPTLAVSDGYWVFLEPLSPGNYELSTKGALGCLEVTCASANFATDARYNLTVK
jgi:hypothetical protein